jgi:eukaryotic-like serine/threonine-protein kinase
MSELQPSNTDAILGGQNLPPLNAAVLGGVAGTKGRLDREVGLSHELATFEIVTINPDSEVVTRQQKQALYCTENLRNSVTLDLVYVPPGSFMMGSAEDRCLNHFDDGRICWDCGYPQHLVNLQAFHMGKYPITQAQYETIMEYKPPAFKGNNHPVTGLNWFQSKEFCNKLSQLTGRTYSLPSESQWEYACRANTTTFFSFGDSIDSDFVNYRSFYPFAPKPEGHKGINRGQTTDVGIFPPNAFGLYDMHGNVREWCLDDVNNYTYEGAPNDGSPYFGNGIKITRGGSWIESFRGCHSAHRSVLAPQMQQDNIGFRIVLAANQIASP